MEKLPIFEAFVDDDSETGVSKISLVDQPAIMIDFVALRKQGVAQTTVVVKQDKQMVYGPLLVPEQKIIRQNQKGTDTYSDDMPDSYYIKYSASTIERARDRFAEGAKFSTALNLMHGEEPVPGVIVEQWIVDGENDKSRSLGFDLPAGTWMAGVRIKDEKFWNGKIKTEELKGFSIEGKFAFAPVEQSTANRHDSRVTNKIIHEWEPEHKSIMSEFNKLMQKIGLVKAGAQNMQQGGDYDKEKEAKMASDVMIETDGKTYRALIAENGSVVLFDPATGESMKAPDGEHTTKSGETIIIKDGKIEMEAATEQAATEQAQPQSAPTQQQPQAQAPQGQSNTESAPQPGAAVNGLRIAENGQLIAPEGHEIISDENGVRVVPVQQLQHQLNGEVANVLIQVSQQLQQNQAQTQQLQVELQQLKQQNAQLTQKINQSSLSSFADFSDTSTQSPNKATGGEGGSFLDEYRKQPGLPSMITSSQIPDFNFGKQQNNGK